MGKTHRWMMLALAASVASGLWAADLSAQQTQTSYTYSRCFKAHPGKMEELRAFFDKTTRIIGEEGVKAGSLAAYNVLEAVTPRGSDTRCDFIANSRFAGYPSSLSPGFDAAMKKLRMESGQFFKQLDEAGYLVRTNLWRGVADAGMGKEGAYIVIDLMKTKDHAAWEEMEEQVFKPMQELRIAAGDTLAWGAAALAMPRGTGLEYDAVTFNVFPDMQSTGKPPMYGELFAKAHPGKSFEGAIKDTLAARDIVESGMYEVIVAVIPE